MILGSSRLIGCGLLAITCGILACKHQETQLMTGALSDAARNHNPDMVRHFASTHSPVQQISVVRDAQRPGSGTAVTTVDAKGKLQLWDSQGQQRFEHDLAIADASGAQLAMGSRFVVATFPNHGSWVWDPTGGGRRVSRLVADPNEAPFATAVDLSESRTGRAMISLAFSPSAVMSSKIGPSIRNFQVNAQNQQAADTYTPYSESLSFATNQLPPRAVAMTAGPGNLNFIAIGSSVEIHDAGSNDQPKPNCLARIDFIDRPAYGRKEHTVAEMVRCTEALRNHTQVSVAVRKGISSISLIENRDERTFGSPQHVTMAIGTKSGQVIVVDDIRVRKFVRDNLTRVDGTEAPPPGKNFVIGITTRFEPLKAMGQQVSESVARDRCSTFSPSPTPSYLSDQSDHLVITGIDFNARADKLVATSSYGVINVINIGSNIDRSLFISEFYPHLEMIGIVKSVLGRGAERTVIGVDQRLVVQEGVAIPPARFLSHRDDVILANALGDLYVWEPDAARKPRPIVQLQGNSTVTEIAISSDGKFLASADTGRNVAVWPSDGQTQGAFGPQPAHHIQRSSAVSSLQFSRNGRLLMFVDDKLRFWDLQGNSVALEYGREGASAGELLPDESHLIIGYEDGRVEVYQRQSRELVYERQFLDQPIVSIRSLRSLGQDHSESGRCNSCYVLQNASGAVSFGDFNIEHYQDLQVRDEQDRLGWTHADYRGQRQFTEYLNARAGTFVMVAENRQNQSFVNPVFDTVSTRRTAPYEQRPLAKANGQHKHLRAIHQWGDDSLVTLRAGLLQNWNVHHCTETAMRVAEELRDANVLAVDPQRRFIVTGGQGGAILRWYMDDTQFLSDIVR